MQWFKIFLIAITFYFIFNQRLNLLNYLGISLCGLWIIFITFSKSGFISDETSNNFILSAILMLVVSVLQVLKDIVMKYYFWYGDNDVNIVHFKVFHDLILYSFIVLFGVYWLWGNFDYSTEVWIFASLSGVFNLLSSIFQNFIIAKSMAGPAEALYATSHSMHIVLDLLIFGGEVNMMQIIGVTFSFLSTIFVIFGNKH